jgi:hypothetical protein
MQMLALVSKASEQTSREEYFYIVDVIFWRITAAILFKQETQ